MAGEMGIVCDMCQLLGGAVPATVSWYSHNFWDAIPTYGYNQAFTIYYAPTALSNVHLFAWQAESCPSLLGSCIWRTSSYTSSTWLPFWKMCTWLGYHFAADNRIQPIHKDLGAGTGKKCRMPQFGIQRTGKDCLSICKLLQRLLEEDMFWNWAAAAIAIVKSTHGGLKDGVQFASFFSSVFVLGFLLGIYPH